MCYIIRYLILILIIKTTTTRMLQYLTNKHMKCGYEKLTSPSKKIIRVGRSCSWVKSVNGRLRGLRLSRRTKKLSLRSFSIILLSSRIVRIYNEVVNRIMKMENTYPTIVLPTQWGFPVLSHPSVVCRRSVIITPNRKVIFYN